MIKSNNYVTAFVKAVGHKFSVETGAQVRDLGPATAVAYNSELIHPWPREFAYRTEFFAGNAPAAQVAAAVQSYFDSAAPEHVLTVFAEDEAAFIHAYERVGYRHAWSNVLLGRTLSAKPQAKAEGMVRPVTTPADVAAMNALEPDHPSSAAALSDPHLHDFVAEWEGTIAAKGQLVTADSGIAYVSDMFTAPAARRRGLGGALLHVLHSAARNAGAAEVILVPSQMTRQVGFYERFGYRSQSPMILFIPRR